MFSIFPVSLSSHRIRKGTTSRRSGSSGAWDLFCAISGMELKVHGCVKSFETISGWDNDGSAHCFGIPVIINFVQALQQSQKSIWERGGGGGVDWNDLQACFNKVLVVSYMTVYWVVLTLLWVFCCFSCMLSKSLWDQFTALCIWYSTLQMYCRGHAGACSKNFSVVVNTFNKSLTH